MCLKVRTTTDGPEDMYNCALVPLSEYRFPMEVVDENPSNFAEKCVAESGAVESVGEQEKEYRPLGE